MLRLGNGVTNRKEINENDDDIMNRNEIVGVHIITRQFIPILTIFHILVNCPKSFLLFSILYTYMNPRKRIYNNFSLFFYFSVSSHLLELIRLFIHKIHTINPAKPSPANSKTSTSDNNISKSFNIQYWHTIHMIQHKIFWYTCIVVVEYLQSSQTLSIHPHSIRYD